MTANINTQTKGYQTERDAARLFNLKKSFPLPRTASQALDEWHNKHKPEPQGQENDANNNK